MGKNKLAKFAELETFPHVFQVPSRVLLEGDGFEIKGRWNELFFKNDNPIVLELGCGKGEYTVELAKQYEQIPQAVIAKTKRVFERVLGKDNTIVKAKDEAHRKKNTSIF